MEWPQLETKQEQNKSFLTPKENTWLVDVKDDFDKSLRDNALPPIEVNLEGEESNPQIKELMIEVVDFRRSASKDRLTYLENRRSLITQGSEYFLEAEAKKSSVSVVSLDIDFFKAYNAISHTFGDLALQTVSNVLVSASKKSGFSVRLGGEEIFMIVEKELSNDEIVKKARFVLENLRLALADLFQLLDEKKGQPGATKDFLENVILTDSRNRKGFNDEYQNKPEFVKVKNDLEMLGFDFSPDISPANFVLILKELILKANEEEKRELQKIRSSLNFDIGTVTAGLIHVDFAEESIISPEDFSEFTGVIKKVFEDDPQKFKKVLTFIKDKPYRLVYEYLIDLAEKLSNEKGDRILDLIERSGKKRFGRLVDRVNSIVDNQKHLQRNSFATEKSSASIFDSEGDKALDEYVVNQYRTIREKLTTNISREVRQSQDSKKPLYPDYMAAKFLKIRKSVKDPSQKKQLSIILDDIIMLQREIYFEPLTLINNYEYLTQVVPGELNQAHKAGQEYSMVSLDVDNLKAINESWGHKMGDVAIMMVAQVFQEELENLPEKYSNKIKKTGFKPNIIRATGGEEFIITLPGLNSKEAQAVFDLINKKLQQAMRNVFDQNIGNETYFDKMQSYVASLPFTDSQGKLLQRSPDELNKIGTTTAGIVSLSEVIDQINENGIINAGKMRSIADEIGETLKSKVYEDGTSGRGSSWTLKQSQS